MIAAVRAQPLSVSHSDPVGVSDWLAMLDLQFSARLNSGEFEKTVLKFQHKGPLRIQKALYPDGLDCCHAVMLHPPGGIAAGDRLEIRVAVERQAHAVVTTPSATKWYGAFEAGLAQQIVNMQVDGHLQWIPSEAIIFDGARVKSALHINVTDQGSMFGWDTQIYGRQASGERFLTGIFDQITRLSLGDELVWVDRLRLNGSDPLFASPVGLQGHHALAMCWAVMPSGGDLLSQKLARLRAAIPEVTFTQPHPRVLIGRLLGHPVNLRAPLECTWRWLHSHLFSKTVSTLRLWAT